MKILTSADDDFLYSRLIDLFIQVKLIQGGSAIPATLRRHSKIKEYLLSKQRSIINELESTYFNDDGLDQIAVENYHFKKEHSLQK